MLFGALHFILYQMTAVSLKETEVIIKKKKKPNFAFLSLSTGQLMQKSVVNVTMWFWSQGR